MRKLLFAAVSLAIALPLAAQAEVATELLSQEKLMEVRAASQVADTAPASPDAVVGLPVMTADGREIGIVERVVRHHNGAGHDVIVDARAYPEMKEPFVAFDASELVPAPTGEGLVARLQVDPATTSHNQPFDN